MKRFYADEKFSYRDDLKFQLSSDEHIETYGDDDRLKLRIHSDSDVIVLAGDIGVGSQVSEIIKKYAENYPDKIFVFVAGNHEFYGRHLQGLSQHYSDAFSSIDNAYYLENSILYIGAVRIIGSTLWTGFDLYGSEHARAMGEYSQGMVNDFRCIKYGQSMMSWQDQRKLNIQSREFLKAALAEPWGGETVVVTHWPPILQCVNTRYGSDRHENPLAAYFNNDLSDLVRGNDILAWLYGHHHARQSFQWEGTWFHSNPAGYEWESDLGHDRDFQFSVNQKGRDI